MVLRRLAACLCALAALAPAARAASYLPPGDHVFAGLSGGSSIAAFQQMVGKHPPVFETFMTWDTPTGWLGRPDRGFRSRLALHIGTAAGYGEAGVITPEQIALGLSDRFLAGLGTHLASSHRVVYVRLMSEMNGYWNAYAAFDSDGASRGASHSPHFYVEAWRRSVLILRGGPSARIDLTLRRLGLPALNLGRHPPARLARPRVAFLWVPQDAGSPPLAANAPGAFWPGAAYVDWIGTDFYASYPNFAQLDAFYGAFPGKPFVLSEWALYGADDPAFVKQLFAWVAAHRRVRMLNYYQGFTASAKPDLAHYPAGRATLRAELRSRRFSAYAPEYAHPAPAAAPPHNPRPGPPPTPPLLNLPGLPLHLCLPLTTICL